MKHNLIVLLALVLCFGCAEQNDNPPFAHIVLVWLDNPNDSDARSAVESGMAELLADSNYIRDWHFGTPANTPRDVVDNSYSYCFIAYFDSPEDERAYQTEAAHQRFLKATSSYISRILVYDSKAIP